MSTDDRLGHVIDCYDYDKQHRIMAVIDADWDRRLRYFFFIGRTPVINFGDKILMNFPKKECRLLRGNGKLTFKITPLDWPGNLLFEVISEWIEI